jgi:acetyl-CoA carboxylase carboxyl transferase subunit beta
MDKTNYMQCTGVGKSKGKEVVICCMDFAFIGGSMGAVVGEKIARGINHAIKTNYLS